MSSRIVLAIAFLMLLGTSALRAQCPGRWLAGGELPYLNGETRALGHWDPDGDGPQPGVLVIGGTFTTAGRQTCNRIATWDGRLFHPIGAGLNGTVRAICTHNGELVVGGEFTESGGTSANRVARWDGASWQPFGTGMNGFVRALAVYNGQLIAAGEFTIAGGAAARHIARWNGSAWVAFGTGISNGTSDHVYALCVRGNELIAGGNFNTAGGVSARRIARWSGGAWQPLGTGTIDGYVRDLVLFEGDLIAAGSFVTMGGVASRRVARWNGTTWQPLAAGVTWTPIALAVVNAELYVGGELDLHRWNGAAWVQITYVDDPIVDMEAYQGQLIAGGQFSRVGALEAPGLAFWDGEQWGVLGTAPNGSIHTLLVHDNDLLVEGGMRNVDGHAAPGPMRWDGVSWHETGATPSGNRLSIFEGQPVLSCWAAVQRWDGTAWAQLGPSLQEGSVTATTTFQGQLVAVGAFNGRVARLSGESWEYFNPGIIAGVYMAEVHGGDLYIGGNFATFYGALGNGVLRYDGTSWLQLGTGLGPIGAAARDIIEYDGDLIIGGEFTDAGGVAARSLARWDGTSWGPFDPDGVQGLDGPSVTVSAMTIYNDDLIVAGVFTTAGGVTVNNIARWNGKEWRALGAGVDGQVNTLAVSDGELVVGGSFRHAGGEVSVNFARWTDSGVAWIARQPEDVEAAPGDSVEFRVMPAGNYGPLAYEWRRNGVPVMDGPGGASKGGALVEGANGGVLSLQGVARSDAGEFTCVVSSECGGVESAAGLLSIACPADFNTDGGVNSQDFFDFLNAFFGQLPSADFNVDSVVNSQDFFDFLIAFFDGCP